jgi:uncharacterized cupin superfamily protein
MAGRDKQTLGDLFGLQNFGVNRTTLRPGGISALRHWHTRQDEFVYVLSGTAMLVMDGGETPLHAGMCVGFKAGEANGHLLANRGTEDVVYLEIGDRTAGDAVTYPDDDIQAVLTPAGQWQFLRKDGSEF